MNFSFLACSDSLHSRSPWMISYVYSCLYMLSLKNISSQLYSSLAFWLPPKFRTCSYASLFVTRDLIKSQTCGEVTSLRSTSYLSLLKYSGVAESIYLGISSFGDVFSSIISLSFFRSFLTKWFSRFFSTLSILLNVA